jgi:Putative holin
VIPLPRAWVLTSALLIGTAVGLILGIALSLIVDTRIRPDVAIALVVGVPSTIGMLMILFSGRRWMTTVGAFVLSIGPGWLGVLVAIQAVNGG